MLEWILTSSVLIIFVLAVRGLFQNRMKAKYTYALWLVVLVRLLCPVNFGEISFNLLSLADKGQEQIENQFEKQSKIENALPSRQENQEIFILDHATDVEVRTYHQAEQPLVGEKKNVSDAGSMKSEPVEAKAELPEINWQKTAHIVWLCGMLVFGVVVFCVNISFSTMLGLFRKELPQLARKGRGKKELAVYLADGINSSCLFGVVRPSIYLNKKEMGEQEQGYCVEHEYSHYLQGDMIWSLCRTLCLILHWYNPLVWLAVALSQKDAELACDERTIERLGEAERYSYGHTLVELAAGQSKAMQVFGMATLMAPDKKEVVDRVKAITRKRETRFLTGLFVTLLLVGISFFVFTGEAKGEQENNKSMAAGTEERKEPAIESSEAEANVAEAEVENVEAEASFAEAEVENAEAEDMAVEASLAEAETENTAAEAIFAEVLEKIAAEKKTAAASERTTARETLEVMPEYQDISFLDHVKLALCEGVSIDLDGDGTKEQLYINEDGIYVNGVRQINAKTCSTSAQIQCIGEDWIPVTDEIIADHWLLDIDTTDGMYELFTGEGNMYIFDGEQLQRVNGIWERFHSSGDGIYHRYLGTLGNFTRVDEHTVSFEDCFFLTATLYANVEYVLDENHGLKIIPKVYDVVESSQHDGLLFYGKVKLYQSPDLSGDYEEVSKLTDIRIKKSDCVNWVYIEGEDGLNGWLYFDEETDYYFVKKLTMTD